MSDQLVDTTQTEPQDLSIKRPRIVEPDDEEEDEVQTVEQQMVETAADGPSIDRPIEGNTDCDSTTGNHPIGTPSPQKALISQPVIRFMSDLYERKVFWDQVLEQSKSTENLDHLKKSLAFKELDVEQVIKNRDKRNVLINCDNELKHLSTKLKFVNELYEGLIDKTKNQINSYHMKDFCKE